MTYVQPVFSTISPFGAPTREMLTDGPVVIGHGSASALSAEAVP